MRRGTLAVVMVSLLAGASASLGTAAAAEPLADTGPVPWGPPILGNDGDQDGIPGNVTFRQRAFVVHDNLVVEDHEGAVLVIVLDADDRDPDVPFRRAVNAPVPTGIVFGPDEDGDGLPSTITIERAYPRLDMNPWNAAPPLVIRVDPDDHDSALPDVQVEDTSGVEARSCEDQATGRGGVCLSSGATATVEGRRVTGPGVDVLWEARFEPGEAPRAGVGLRAHVDGRTFRVGSV